MSGKTMNGFIAFCKKRWLWLATALLLIAGGGAWTQGWLTPKAEIKYKTVKLDKGLITATVSASGTINPVSSVTIGSQVSGQMKAVLADFNTEVKAGQIIARIDPEIFEYRVRQAQADVDSARAQQLVAQSTLSARRADLSRAEVNFGEAKSDVVRKKTLFDKQFISSADLDKASSLVKTVEEDLKTAQANIAVAQAQVKSAESSTKQKIAGLDSAKGDLSRTVITSPVSGVVIKRSIEVGQTVAASLSAPELFVIAKNLQDMQVDTAIDESDIGKIKPGMKATFTVDAFAGRSFTGEVSQVRKAAQTVQNVVTYIAVIAFSNTDGVLLPGMTANVRVVTNERTNVLRVPNAALRFKPAGTDEKMTDKPSLSAPPAAASVQAGAASTGGGGAALRAYRERLEKELNLTEAQKKQLDDMNAGMRERYAAVRDLPEELRPKAMANIRADAREKTAAMLTAEQKTKFDAINAELAAARQASGGAPARAKLWILDETGKPKAIDVRTGTSDGTVTEIINPAETVKEGLEVLAGVQTTNTKASTSAGGPPRSPF
jgi:HlyD family secretion protein